MSSFLSANDTFKIKFIYSFSAQTLIEENCLGTRIYRKSLRQPAQHYLSKSEEWHLKRNYNEIGSV